MAIDYMSFAALIVCAAVFMIGMLAYNSKKKNQE